MKLDMPLILAYVGLWAAVTGGVWTLFARIETVISPEARTAVSRWLRNLDLAGALPNWPAAFAVVFDRVFGERHFSWRCFSRSCVASYAGVLIVTLIWGVLRPTQFTAFFEDADTSYLFLFPLFTGILNVVPDYCSLLETRYVIRWMSRERSVVRILGFLAIDFAFTLAIASGAWFLMYMGFSFFVGGPDLDVEYMFIVWKEGLILSAGSSEDITLGIFLYSTFFTSVWVWLYALSGLIVKLGQYLGLGFSWLRAILDIENKPLRSMGMVLNILITILFLIFFPFLK